jgi:hypothetical protein
VSQRFTELNDFPFDTHTIWFTIEPFGFSEKNSVQFVEFSPDDELITAARRAKSAGKLESEEWKFREQAPNVMGVPPSITTSLEIKRHTGFYWQNIILPLILIVSISCTVFWMRYQLHERLGVSITVLLTVVAFDFLTSDNLPRLAYTTRLDMFYNVSYVAVTLTIVFSVAATRWNSGRASDDDSDPGKAPAHGAPTSDATADELGGETSVPADPAEPFTAPDAAAPEAEAT